jgi:MFS family permease
MTAIPDAPRKPRALAVLLGASLTQCAAAVGFWSYSLLAPELAAVTGLNDRDFGLATSFIFLGTFLSSGFTGVLVSRFGGRGSLTLVLAAMGGFVLLTLAASWWAVMLSALLYGIAYGPQGAISMTLVTQSAERRMRGLFLSIRHSSVPAAMAVIGRVLPPLMGWAGWQTGVLSVSAAVFAVVGFTLVAQPLYRLGTEGRAKVAGGQGGGLLRGIREKFRVPPHLRFLWGAGLAFAVTQNAVTFFSYLYLLEVAGLDPVAAGIFASNLHLTALIGRPVLGWVCDRTGRPVVVLAALAAMAVVTVIAVLQVGAGTPGWVLVPLAVACGLAGQCWNPVFVTAMSDKVPEADLAEMNGRAFAFLSLGWMSAAPLFWALIEVSGGYAVPFLMVAAVNAAVATVLLRSTLR